MNGRDGGFRRTSPAPEPQALVRLRALLLEVAGEGTPLLRQGLEGFESWQAIATLCGTEWSTGILTGSAAARRVLRRRLQVLGTRPVTVGRAAEMPVGTPVHLHGIARPVLLSRLNAHMSYIWSRSAMTTDNVRATAEEGHDFFLVDGDGQTARVIADRGYLLNAEKLVAGEAVSVFGHTDRAPAPAGSADRSASDLAVRAGDDVPLLIRRVPQTR